MNDNLKNEERKIPVKDSLQFYEEIIKRCYYHKSLAKKHVKTFKLLGFIFGLLIPILSAFLTYSISAEPSIPKSISAIVALALTILTIVNSTLKPEEKFKQSAQICIELTDWKRELDIDIAKLNQKNNEDQSFHDLITNMDKRLSEIGKKMADNWVPRPDVK